MHKASKMQLGTAVRHLDTGSRELGMYIHYSGVRRQIKNWYKPNSLSFNETEFQVRHFVVV